MYSRAFLPSSAVAVRRRGRKLGDATIPVGAHTVNARSQAEALALAQSTATYYGKPVASVTLLPSTTQQFNGVSLDAYLVTYSGEDQAAIQSAVIASMNLPPGVTVTQLNQQGLDQVAKAAAAASSTSTTSTTSSTSTAATSASSIFGSIPWWVWAAAGGALLLMGGGSEGTSSSKRRR